MQTKFTEIANKITTIKSNLAEAISNKGVHTESNASFSTMIENIGNIAGDEDSETLVVEEWTKPHDWIDIEAEPLEVGEVRVLMCDLLGTDNNIIYFARRSGATSIKASIDWGDGTQEEVDVKSVASKIINHNFNGNGVPCSRGYNIYVVRIRFNEPESAPQQMYFYRNGASSSNNIHNNVLWIYGDVQYFTNLNNFTCYTSNYSNSILLERLNLINTNNVTTMKNMLYGCYSLKSIPQLDTSNVTDMSSMFYKCYSIKKIPQLDTNNVTNMSSMFAHCFSLEKSPQLDTSKVTNLSYLYYQCYSIKSIPQIDSSNATAITSMIFGCVSLRKAPPIDIRKVSSVANMNNIFGECYNLFEVGTIMLSKDIALSIGYSACRPPIIKIDLAFDELDPPVFTQTTPIKINYTQLSAESLNKLMEQLPDGNGKTLDLKFNAGSLGCDPSIATSKNWTVLVN